MTKDVIIRKKQGRGEGAGGFQAGISEPSVSKDATSAREHDEVWGGHAASQ